MSRRTDVVVDAVAVAVLMLAALYGFGAAYGGWTYLLVGALGTAVGLVVAAAALRTHAPLLASVALIVVVFFLLGGSVAFGPDSAVPTRTSLARLLDGAVHGWLQLLTVLPPVGRSGNLMAIPYLLGLLGAFSTLLLARRTTRSWSPMLIPAAVLALSILFGTAEPASVLVQGGGFAAPALAWLAVRARRGIATATPPRRRTLVTGAVTAIAVSAAGVVLGPMLPLASANPRLVVRERVQPPFDPRDYPSPLSDYRRYVLPGSHYLRDQILFTVDGLPPGALVRTAVLDDYDGTVWNVAGGPTAPAGSGSFQRVGDTIPTDVTGDRRTMRVSVRSLGTPGGASGPVWLPSAGTVTAARFSGPAATELADTFRYNRGTDTAVTGTTPRFASRGLRQGDSYELDVVLPESAAPAEPGSALYARLVAAAPSSAPLPVVGADVEAVKSRADEFAGQSTNAYERAAAIARTLHDTAFLSDGAADQPPSAPGHHAARLAELVGREQYLVGNAEQFAALAALMARQLDLPARVVLGVRLARAPAEGPVEVKGKDVTAWIEVGLDGEGWVPLLPTPESVRTPQEQPQPKPLSVVKDPPRPPRQPNLELDTSSSDTPPSTKPPVRSTADDGVPTWALVAGVSAVPVGVLALAGGLIAAVKVLRRRRRRQVGDPTRRIVAGWDELLDHAQDGGIAVPDVATRRERCAFLGASPTVVALAERADRAVFAPDLAEPAEVDRYWAEVMRARTELSLSFGRRGRLRAAVNLASLSLPSLKLPFRRTR